MSKLSIIIPVFFNEMNLEDLYKDLEIKVLTLCGDYEIVFVDDGSQDKSLEIIKKLSQHDQNIKYLKLSRNFGSHAAILAGLNYCTGDCAVMKSADLQEPSEILLEMYDKWKNGKKVVLAVRTDRDEGKMQSLFSNIYYQVMRRYVIQSMPKGGFDCFLIDRKVIEVLRLMDEKNTTLMGQILWAGFDSDIIEYRRLKREKGISRWTLGKKIKLFVDSILSFTLLPIKIISFIGFSYISIAFIWGIIIVVARIFGGISIDGWSTIMVTILLSFGLVIFMLGIIGEYIWRVFDATRSRPVYIVEESKID
jgi:polyisoprenyl-phosphate glycosyltransferase